MHAEANEIDKHSSIDSVGTGFNAGHVGDVAIHEMRRIHQDIGDRIRQVESLMQYLTSSYGADIQRHQAEVRLNQMIQEIDCAASTLTNPLEMIATLSYPVKSLAK